MLTKGKKTRKIVLTLKKLNYGNELCSTGTRGFGSYG